MPLDGSLGSKRSHVPPIVKNGNNKNSLKEHPSGLVVDFVAPNCFLSLETGGRWYQSVVLFQESLVDPRALEETTMGTALGDDAPMGWYTTSDLVDLVVFPSPVGSCKGTAAVPASWRSNSGCFVAMDGDSLWVLSLVHSV